ncbi:MAG: hypothetical protein MUC38_10735 [Cyclobacteriaceae bacterium]|jgi:hypothetical protein|nr:hypothetical protein [Cyclobacteriaceae bacterium]
MSVLLVSLVRGHHLVAQDRDKTPDIPLDRYYVDRDKVGLFRRIMSKLHWSVGLGYGTTFFKHDLTGFLLYNPAGGGPQIFQGTVPPSGRLTNWVNRTEADSSAFVPTAFLVNSDTASLGFKGRAWNIPLKLSVHYEFKQRYRIGAGYSFEYMNLGEFKPMSFENDIASFNPGPAGGLMRKYYLLLGASFYRFDKFLFTGDAHIGGFRPGGNFEGVIKRSVVVNLGVTIEREMSEYFRLYVRPAYEFKSYTLGLPEVASGLRHRMNGAYVTVGLVYRMPELRKCVFKSCSAQVNHAHGNKEYRSRMHPIWKTQDPGYGENYPTLIKYKKKNRRKLNPY